MTFLIIIGSLGLFLYGLQLMSESLQKIAGDNLRKVQSAMTRNRLTGVLAGIAVTALVQSSSVTTLMAVSFVNAGLINLAESMAVIMGANVGSTVTAWLMALLGFRFSHYLIGLVSVACALPFINSHKATSKAWGELFFGFGLLIFGIMVMNYKMQDIALDQGFLHLLDSSYSHSTLSVLLYILIGISVTLLLQTSSATFMLVAVMSSCQLMPFLIGCGVIIGANIGTCIMPLIASREAKKTAKQAAMGHLLFNITGLIWSVCILGYLGDMVCQVVSSLGLGSADDPANLPFALALFHTSFNLITLCLLLPFNKYCVRLIEKIIPNKHQVSDSFELTYIDGSLLSSSGEMALVQVQKEVSRYAQDTYKMFSLVREMLAEPMGTEKQSLLASKIREMEEHSDKAEFEIAQFLNQISPHTLSDSGESLCRSLYKIVDELESIADAIRHCSDSIDQKSEHRIRFNAEMNANINTMFSLTDDALLHMVRMIQLDEMPRNALDKAYNYEDEINNFRNQMRNEMLDSIDRRVIVYEQNTFFMLLINECEKIGDYAINVMAAATY